MSNSIDKIYEIALYGLNLTHVQIYLENIDMQLDMLQEDSSYVAKKLIALREKIVAGCYDESPEEFSVEIFGANIFTLDVFDLHMLAYDNIKAKILDIFDKEIVPTIQDRLILTSVQRSRRIFANMFGEDVNCRSRNGNRPYYSHKYWDFLRNRKEQISLMAREIELLRFLLENENSEKI